MKDVPFTLLNSPGGNLQDDADWTDGLTAPQWPEIQWRTAADGGGSDVTSSFNHDITSETITAATHKHPTPTTGIWRKAMGVYRHRVQPAAGLSFADYYMRVTYNPGSSSSYTEEHVFSLIAPGDISFTDLVFGSITVDDIQALIQTSLTDEELEPLLAEAVNAAEAWLEDVCGVDPDTLEELPKSVRVAILAYALGLVQVYDASASGLDTATEIREGSEVIKFGNRVTSKNYVDTFDLWMSRYCRGRRAAMGPMFKATNRLVGHSVND